MISVIKVITVSLIILLAGCVNRDPVNTDFSKNVYLSMIEQEERGAPCFQEGNTWEQYWKQVISVIKEESSDEQRTELLEIIQRERAIRGLDPYSDFISCTTSCNNE